MLLPYMMIWKTSVRTRHWHVMNTVVQRYLRQITNGPELRQVMGKRTESATSRIWFRSADDSSAMSAENKGGSCHSNYYYNFHTPYTLSMHWVPLTTGKATFTDCEMTILQGKMTDHRAFFWKNTAFSVVRTACADLHVCLYKWKYYKIHTT